MSNRARYALSLCSGRCQVIGDRSMIGLVAKEDPG